MSEPDDLKQDVAVSEKILSPPPLDGAWKYLDAHHSIVHGEPADLGALKRRIDWHILPLAFLCYLMQSIDKVLINVIGCSSLPNITLTLSIVRCSHGSTGGLGVKRQRLLKCCYRVFHCLFDCRVTQR